MLLHEKVDLLREKQWSELLTMQKEQLKILGDLIEKNSRAHPLEQNDTAQGVQRDLMGNRVGDEPDIAPS